MAYRLEITAGGWPAEEAGEGIEGLLAASTVLTLATSADALGPHANLAFFAYDRDLVLYFVSERTTRHSRYLAGEPRAAATVFVPPPVFGERLRGVQVSGRAGEARGEQARAAFAAYQARFPRFGEDPAVREQFLHGTGAAALYRLRVDELTAVDEPRFGRRDYLTARVVRPGADDGPDPL